MRADQSSEQNLAPEWRIRVLVGALGATHTDVRRTLNSVLRQLGALPDFGERPTVTVVGAMAPSRATFDNRIRWDVDESADSANTTPGAIVWIEAGAELRAGALRRLLEVAHRFDAALVYADGTDSSGQRSRRIERPDPSPLRLLEQDYLGDVILLGPDGLAGMNARGPSSRLDVLRIAWSLESHRMVHLPEKLADRKGSRLAEQSDLHRGAILRHLSASGIDAQVDSAPQSPGPTTFRVRFRPSGQATVSIIIPTRGATASVRGRERVLVVEAVRSIMRSSYPRLEFVVVADDVVSQAVVDELIEIAGDRMTIVRWSQPFNFSGKINRGAAHAGGSHFLLLNDDVELISNDWLETMVGIVEQPGIGMVGANLLFGDDRVQHAGHFYRARGADHIAFGWSPEDDDHLGSLHVDREVSGVTAACALLSRDLFERVGGLSTLLPGNYNDVDLSLKVRATGARIVWTPWARLYHYESQTREPTSSEAELARLRTRWGTRIEVDGFWPERPVLVRHD